MLSDVLCAAGTFGNPQDSNSEQNEVEGDFVVYENPWENLDRYSEHIQKDSLSFRLQFFSVSEFVILIFGNLACCFVLGVLKKWPPSRPSGAPIYCAMRRRPDFWRLSSALGTNSTPRFPMARCDAMLRPGNVARAIQRNRRCSRPIQHDAKLNRGSGHRPGSSKINGVRVASPILAGVSPTVTKRLNRAPPP